MPIYEYECSDCGHHTELLQKFSDPPLEECELCRGRMKKLISHNNFHLKGSGWYVTDYASKSGGNQGSHPGSSDAAPKAESKASTDKKGEAVSSDSGKTEKKKSSSDE